MDAKKLVIYYTPVGLAIRLRRSTNRLREVDRTDGIMHFEQREYFEQQPAMVFESDDE